MTVVFNAYLWLCFYEQIVNGMILVVNLCFANGKPHNRIAIVSHFRQLSDELQISDKFDN